MIDMSKLEWELRPFRKMDVLAAYGARTIFQRSEIEFLRDRQQFLGNEEQREALCNWINNKALPAMKTHIRENFWDQETDEIFTLNDWPFVLEASPKCSYGYLYISAYLKGLDRLPEKFQWSGGDIPNIGQTVFCKANSIGYASVLGYYLEAGWLGVIVWPNDPPDWYVRQNGRDAICGVFGVEIGTVAEATEPMESSDESR
jgi:hypothetical protein